GGDDNVPPREAPAPRRGPRRHRDDGARRNGRRRDVSAQAPDPALRWGARRGQSPSPRVLGLRRVRRRGARPGDLQRGGRALLLPPARRGCGTRPLLRRDARRRPGAEPRRANTPLYPADARRALSRGLSRVLRGGPGARARCRDRSGRALAARATGRRSDRRVARPDARHRAPPRMSVVADASVWRLPPRWVLLVALLSIASAEIGGGAMARFKVELARWARDRMLARPAVHGLVGVRDVDERILDEALVKFDAGLRLFHMHAEGMGLVIIATTTVATTLVASPALRRALVTLLTAGGAGYPLGYLLWSALIPYYGIERGKALAEWLCWIPFGGATILATWWLAALIAFRVAR